MVDAVRRALSAQRGVRLSRAEHQARHGVLRVVLWLQLPLLVLVWRLGPGFQKSPDGMTEMPGMENSDSSMVWWMGAAVLLCAIASLTVGSRRGGAMLVSLGLLVSAASVVTLGGGLTDLHFGFFVVVGLISLYQDWLILVLAIVLISAHHVVMGLLDPAVLYSSPGARLHPLRFAALHGGFVVAACVVQVVYWRFAQVAQLEKENARLDTNQTMRRIAERSEALAQDSRDAIIVMDRQGIILSANAAAQRLTGCRPDDLVGTQYRTLIHPDDLSRLTATTDQGREEYRGERRMRHADGNWRWHDVTIRDLSDHRAVRGIVVNHRDASERRQYQETLVYDASHDALTGLVNRGEFLRSLERSLSVSPDGSSGVAVLYLDLNGFKKINDTYGHETGDALLVVVANALRRSLLGADSVGRLGGDEFAVILHQISAARGAIVVAERILVEVSQPVSINGITVSPRVSIGIALAHGGELETDQLVHRADTAMYHAKRDSTSDWQLYIDGMHDPSGIAATLEDDLRLAVERGQLELQYQPIVGLVDGELIGLEALVRWRHPTRGLLQPADFVELAGQSDLIDDVGRWVLRQACAQVGQWQERHTSLPRLTLHVNIGARQLRHHSLTADVLAILADTGYPAKDLVLEVAESALVHAETSISQLNVLREHGIRVALDEFGGGTSSLRHLAGLPVDILKLDICFVAELNATPKGSAVCHAIIRLGRTLDLDTVAVGVETQAQATELALLGCHAAQGFHYCVPLEPERLDALLASGTTSGVRLPQVATAANGK